jgi:hypothetical protein
MYLYRLQSDQFYTWSDHNAQIIHRRLERERGGISVREWTDWAGPSKYGLLSPSPQFVTHPLFELVTLVEPRNINESVKQKRS